MAQAQPHAPTGTGNEPRDNLDVAYSIIRPSEYNDLLRQINFGTGYYEDEELALQMSNVRKGLVTDIAFAPMLRKHAEQETKVKLADEGFSYFDGSMNEPKVWEPLDSVGGKWKRELEKQGRTAVLFDRGEEIWQELADPEYSLSIKQAAALDSKASLSTFKPIFNHLAAMYHELTKSKGARTQDNYFGRVNRHEMAGEEPSERTRKLFAGLRGGE